ncbi:MAG: glycosyltransferase family 4 protein [Gemmatimonadetes bacterium]|nr:glycosyltransferase family 4 protein [Gemmatimonadota bacterium]
MSAAADGVSPLPALPPPRHRDGRAVRVLFVTITFDPEPGAQRGLPLARWLMARGYDVRVLTGFPQWPLGRTFDGYRQRPWMREVMEGVPVLRVPLYPSHDANPLRRIATYLSFMLSATCIGVPLLGRGDVVFLYEPPPTNGVPALLLRLLHGAPIVHQIADLWPDTVLASGMLPRGLHRVADASIGAFCRFLYRRAAVVGVLSAGAARLLEARGVPRDTLLVSYNWADETLFAPAAPDPALRTAMALDGRIGFVYAGNVGPLQGVETIVRAAALAGARDARIAVRIVGDGPTLAAAQQVAADLGAAAAAPTLQFLPRRAYHEMNAVNAVSDVMLAHLRALPFLDVTVPSKVSVAMASGRPLLIGARGDTAQLVEQAACGIAVPPEDPTAMADAMVRLAAMSTAEREAMGARGRAYYDRHLALDVAGAALDATFRRLAGVA